MRELALEVQLEAGDLNRLAALLTAAPTLTVTFLLAVIVMLHADNRADEAAELTTQLIAQATPVQRHAHAIRLRALREHIPDLPHLGQLIAQIENVTKSELMVEETTRWLVLFAWRSLCSAAGYGMILG